MNNKEKDERIKQKLQSDKYIPETINDIFKNFDKKNITKDAKGHSEKSNIKLISTILGIAASIAIVIFVGTTLYANSKERPSVISAIEALIKKDDTVNLENVNNNIANNLRNTANSIDKIEKPIVKEEKTNDYTNQAKNIINMYFKLKEQSSAKNLLNYVGLQYTIEDIPKEEKILDNGYYYDKTSLVYEEFKNTMLKYMTSNMFKKFIDSYLWYKNIDGILYIADYIAEGTKCYVEEVTLKSQNDNIYEYWVSYKYEGDSVTSYKTFYLEIVNENARIYSVEI